MAIARQIVGPQAKYERTGAQSLRDIRPFTTRLSEALRGSASFLVLSGAAVATWFAPALIDLTVPASALYAIWVLTRRPSLPIRLPRSARCLDHGNPQPGSRKAQRARGDIFIGWSTDGQELWITAEDARQHMTIPGTTGAGKTTAILSLLVNALAQGSGFVLVDGKADRTLFGKVLALARRFGREDDVRVLNFLVASGSRSSNTFNCFASGNADAVRELMASQLGERNPNDPNGLFQGRAVALLGTIAPVLVWLRDHKGVLLNIDVIRQSIELRWIYKLAMHKTFSLRDPITGKSEEVSIGGEIPDDLIYPLRAYLGELPGYDPTVPLEQQKSDKPSEQHGYAQFYFTETFAQLAVSLGHIFKVENGDIDMRDIVLNRRILVVNLPALENSDTTLAALGKLVVASLRGMMAQMLGASLDGDYSDAERPGMGPAPFPVVFDELAYYATSGLDRMLAQGRSLNISFILGFQEVSGIWARLGEKTASLLGNANLTIAMRQQDGGRTREWIEKTAGQTYITQATSYQGSEDGAYREARHAEVRPVSRVDWQDLTSLIEGEAIVLFGGRRVYARVFHAAIDDHGPKRRCRGLMLREPNVVQLRQQMERAEKIASVIASGTLRLSPEEPLSPVLGAALRAFGDAARKGSQREACAQAALRAIDTVPEGLRTPCPPPPADGSPVTSVSSMLWDAAYEPRAAARAEGAPQEPIDGLTLRALEAVERAAGAAPPIARQIALSILRARDEALAGSPRVDPPPMTSAAFSRLLDDLSDRIAAAARQPARKAA